MPFALSSTLRAGEEAVGSASLTPTPTQTSFGTDIVTETAMLLAVYYLVLRYSACQKQQRVRQADILCLVGCVFVFSRLCVTCSMSRQAFIARSVTQIRP